MKLNQTGLAAVAAGVMVGIGGTVFLSAPDKTVGAVLFSIGLLTICLYGFKLYTGAIGYLLLESTTPAGSRLLTAACIWVGNLLGTGLVGFALYHARPELAAKAAALCTTKLTQSISYNLTMGILCGLLMYLAVDIYRRQEGFGRYLGILFAVPVFILSGYEHSVADMFYLALGAGRLPLAGGELLFLLTVTVGNTLGAALIPLALSGQELAARRTETT